jgi:CHAT domain-containing protein
VRSIQAPSDSTPDGLPGARLYDLLIRPLEAQLREGEPLVIVPDKALYDVPFAALQDSRSGRYLIQDHRLSASPSATLFIESLDRQRQIPSTPPRSALAIQNPTFDRAAFTRLRPLAFAEKEARQIVESYPVAEVQKEAGATKQLFLERAPKFEIVDFAGHAVVNEQNPSLSMLLFAPDLRRRDSGRLYVHEIAAASFTRTRLVVLAACGTSQGQVRDVEGVVSIARAFLGAGALAVLATLWEVDDEATAKLLEGFHRRLVEGDNAADALRSSQLAMLQGIDPAFRKPGVWAPFVIIGWLSG